MNILGKKFKTAVFALSIALGLMFGATQESKAAFYNNYQTLFATYLNLFHRTGITQYYWDAIAFHYYYLAGYNGDYYGYKADPFAFKSTYYAGSTWAGYFYSTYTYWGDYFARF